MVTRAAQSTHLRSSADSRLSAHALSRQHLTPPSLGTARELWEEGHQFNSIHNKGYDHHGIVIVTFTDQFRYLGAIISSSLTDDAEITNRIRSAAAAFGSLQRWVFGQSFGSKSLPLSSKGKLYGSLVLGILLYGCESWVLTQPLLQRLHTFHNGCVRSMTGRAARVPDGEHARRRALAPLYSALGLTSIDKYISNRKLRWAGHVMRMDMSRLPRKFMTAWVDVPRERGRPVHSYGHDLARELNSIGFNLDRRAVGIGASQSWGEAAQNRELWRELSCTIMQTKPISDQAPVVQPRATNWSHRLRSRMVGGAP